jgi:hypothetical protein
MPVNVIYIIVLCVFQSAVDTKLVYLPILGALAGNILGYEMLESAIASFVVSVGFSLAVRLIRNGRSFDGK